MGGSILLDAQFFATPFPLALSVLGAIMLDTAPDIPDRDLNIAIVEYFTD